MEDTHTKPCEGVVLHCGWGRLLFAHTFPSPESVAHEILLEKPGERDIAFYLTDPHIVLNTAPQALFLDPSHTFRLEFSNYKPSANEPGVFTIGRIETPADIAAINRIYSTLNMVPVDPDYLLANKASRQFHYIVARENESNEVIGVAMGVDHMENFQDICNGSSLWSLAVDPQIAHPGVGEWLVRHLIEEFRDRGRSQLDLSVMHDNQSAIGLYEKLGFERVAVFAIKRCNSINEKLFVPSPPHTGFNPYARIIIDEALRRGIEVEALDATRGYFRLSLGGRMVICRESLSELTSAIAMSRCDDKQLTREILEKAGLNVPAQILAGDPDEHASFLSTHKRVVVKPMRGEQGKGISVDLNCTEDLESAILTAQKECEDVLIESYIEGEDLRIIVIGNEVVAAAIRKPAEVMGTGEHTVEQLISRLSRRRSAATAGESKVPVDNETIRCVAAEGYQLSDTPPEGTRIRVRKTANLHTGGTIHDVTDRLHPDLTTAAVTAAQALQIPVVGLDFLVPSVEEPEYAIIEANERPGLANHEPQPTARKFIDLLFPYTIETITTHS